MAAILSRPQCVKKLNNIDATLAALEDFPNYFHRSSLSLTSLMAHVCILRGLMYHPL